jgi:GNAT superfamily N-acetyltransferase
MGFSDMDHEGMLIDGFEELGTMATIYNYPYYPQHMERMGFVKDAEWVEYRIAIPSEVPDKYQRIADIVKKKYNLRVKKYTNRKKLKDEYGQALFELINEAYDDLYGYSPLTPKQIDHYIDMYLGILRLDCVCVVVDSEDRLVGVGISLPSLSKALQRGKGRLLPLGWWHLLQALKWKNDVVDLMLIAIKPEYQSKGVNALLFSDLIPTYVKNGYKWAESNLELEDNASVQLQWQYFDRRLHRRRRAFRKPL